jgi:hypothetical protein
MVKATVTATAPSATPAAVWARLVAPPTAHLRTAGTGRGADGLFHVRVMRQEREYRSPH